MYVIPPLVASLSFSTATEPRTVQWQSRSHPRGRLPVTTTIAKTSATLCALLILGTPMPLHATANYCDKKLKPANENARYAERENRCEGMYAVREVSDATLDLIGFVKGRFEYSQDPSEMIEIRIPPGIPATYNPVLIQAQPFSLATYYRMDSVLNQGEVLSWPVKDVLHPKNIESKHIGVRGSYRVKGKSSGNEVTIHLPLQVSSQINRSDRDTRLRLYLRPTQDIDYLWSGWDCGNLQPITTSTQEVFRSAKPIILFPPNGLKGLCQVSFIGVIKKRDVGGEVNQVKLDLLVHLGD